MALVPPKKKVEPEKLLVKKKLKKSDVYASVHEVPYVSEPDRPFGFVECIVFATSENPYIIMLRRARHLDKRYGKFNNEYLYNLLTMTIIPITYDMTWDDIRSLKSRRRRSTKDTVNGQEAKTKT